MTTYVNARGAGTPAGAGPPLLAVWPAALIAGPLFLTSLAAASLYLTLPAPIIIEPKEVLIFSIMLVPATVIGTVLSFLPILAASTLLHGPGIRFPGLRSRRVWAATGALAGASMARAFDLNLAELEIGFACVVTATACALVARRSLYGTK